MTDDNTTLGVTRREILALASSIGVVGLGTNASLARTTEREFEYEQVVGKKDWMYDTIQAAHDDLPDVTAAGGKIYVTREYDASLETFPITITKHVTVEGASRTGTVVDADTSPNTVFLIKEAEQSYANSTTIKNLKIRGGDVGVNIDPETHVILQNIGVYGQASHGVAQLGNNALPQGSFLNVFRNVDVAYTDGHGFHISSDSVAHANVFDRCTSLRNARNGANLRGVATYVKGGAYQLNGHHGVRFRTYANQSIRDAYFEGNANAAQAEESDPYGVDVLLEDTHAVVDNCYFFGSNGAKLGVEVRGCDNVQVQNCLFRHHEKGGISIDKDSTDTDVHLHQNHTARFSSTGEPILFKDNGTRTRSDGVILPTDLSKTEGQQSYDIGFDKGNNTSSGNPEMAVWSNGSWYTWGGEEITPS